MAKNSGLIVRVMMGTDRGFTNQGAYPSLRKGSQDSAPNSWTIWGFRFHTARYSGFPREAKISEFSIESYIVCWCRI